MQKIKLSGKNQELFALVDDDDFERVSALKWYKLSVKGSRTNYARASLRKKTIYLHRFVLNAPSGREVDHIDGNGLNNTRSNLRLISHAGNMRAKVSRIAFETWFEAYKTKKETETGKSPVKRSRKNASNVC